VFVIVSAWQDILAIRPYDPWATYHHITTAELFKEFMAPIKETAHEENSGFDMESVRQFVREQKEKYH